jgi:UDP-GlcNAc:undecaprenyl-phosphate GlcNAc-1-phosphate transferase
VVVIVAVAVGLVATPAAAWLARRVGLLDHPGPLKVQQQPVPYLGGLAVLGATAAGLVIARPAWLVPLALALALGTLDDARSLPPRIRLAGEAGVGLVAGVLVPSGIAQPWAAAGTVVIVVLLINAVNLIDGLDALATGVAWVSAMGFAIALDGDDRTVALALAGALAAFLVYNRPPARIYLGDGGAYLLGTALAVLLVGAWRPERELALSIGSLLFVAFPVAEVACAVVRRARVHAPLFSGDRRHLYDQLVQRGWSAAGTSLACAATQAVLCGLGLLAAQAAAAVAAAVVVATAVAFLAGAAAGGFLSSASPRGAS